MLCSYCELLLDCPEAQERFVVDSFHVFELLAPLPLLSDTVISKVQILNTNFCHVSVQSACPKKTHAWMRNILESGKSVPFTRKKRGQKRVRQKESWTHQILSLFVSFCIYLLEHKILRRTDQRIWRTYQRIWRTDQRFVKRLNARSIKMLYRREFLTLIKDGTYMGAWSEISELSTEWSVSYLHSGENQDRYRRWF